MQLGKVNLILLNALYHLLNERSVSRAAEQMHISQSAMSKHLSKLRDLFGDPLLVRVDGQWQTTDRGQALKTQVASVLESIDSLLQQQAFEPGKCQRTIRFATSDYVSAHLLPPLLAQVFEQAPQLKIELLNWDDSTPHQLSQGAVDIGMTLPPKDSGDFHARALGEDKLVCMMRNDHPYLALSDPQASDYCRFAHASVHSGADKFSSIDKLLRAQGQSRQIQLQGISYAATLELVTETPFILTLPEKIARHYHDRHPRLVITSLPLKQQAFEFSLIWHHRQHHDPAHQWFRQTLIEQLGH
ncbi:LysR family transcriptional regulator [Aliagarivorans taiwanensis]|uniref:LysR family transcriptional regulator n=1 Tax=Aliagarivorans taiwanensis TaxID=561966 RepID=UPI000428B1BB|nr:LysR family transcriptional regulator [Aliagarivorans taiwanensis]